jgi:CheY-like chemotaxis protein
MEKPVTGPPLPPIGAEADAADRAARQGITQTLKPLSILAAEDNRFNLKMIVTLLKMRGHEVVPVSGGKTAVDAVRIRNFDIILMDIQMPDMDGLEAARLIREIEKDKGGRIPIIALTAHAQDGDEQRFLAVGMDACLTKPLNKDTLFSVIETLARPAPDRETRSQVIRLDQLLSDFDGDAGDLHHLTRLFIKGVSRRIIRLRQGLVQGDHEMMRREAHTIKGMCGNFTAFRASAAALALEKAITQKDMAEAQTLLAGLEEEIQHIKKVLVREGYLPAC